MLLCCMGQEADNILSFLGISEEKITSFDSVVTAFQDYFTMKENKFYYRALFLERKQMPGEQFDTYIDELGKLSEKCDWTPKNFKNKDFESEMILTKLITGINDERVSKLLLRQGISTLTDCIEILRKFEVELKRSKKDDFPMDFSLKNSEIWKPGTQQKENCLKKESDVSNNRKIAGPATFIPVSQDHDDILSKHSSCKFVNREVKEYVRSSISSGIDTSDECTLQKNKLKKEHDGNSNTNAQSTTSNPIGQRQDDISPRHFSCKYVYREEKRDMRSSFSSGIDTGDEYKPNPWHCVTKSPEFDSDEEDEYSKKQDVSEKNNSLPYTSNENILTDFDSDKEFNYWLEYYLPWSNSKETIYKKDENPKPFENFHFSVTGHQSRRALRKMCQQRQKNMYRS